MEKLERYAQQIKLPSIGINGQEKLQQARVLCVGAGGLASPLLLYLAAAGVGSLGIIDDDRVELSNLQRQILYTTNDIGKKKAAQAKQALSNLNHHVNVSVHPYRITHSNVEEIISHYDIIADCSDNFTTRYLINDACFKLSKPFVFASIHQFSGQCATIYPQKGCFRCLFPNSPGVEGLPRCDMGGVIGVLPGLLGVIQATEVLKYILGIGELLIGRFVSIDILSLQWSEFNWSQDPNCALCMLDQLENVSEEISVTELKDKIQNSNSLFLLDVRTPEEHAMFNIGGKLIPLQELSERLNELNREDDIIIYCHLGQRSLSALELLKKAHFSRVRSLAGGLRAWQNQSS
jgi:adenylyltransferase/sulfurtransferase